MRDQEPSAAVFAWISTFPNMERGSLPAAAARIRSFRLDRMEILADMADHPERFAPVIHIAGSKGKGSVTGMISAMLQGAGIPAARYCSPHVSDYRERIGLGTGFFPESVYADAGEELRALIQALEDAPAAARRLFDPQDPEGAPPTFFELMTLYFFLCARRGQCEALVVETGMGGRLDATNIVDPRASVITSIELEHTAYLGNTLAAIAGEKAGIIKPGRPLILGEQEAEALAVFREACAQKGAPLRYAPELAHIEDVLLSREGTSFSLAFPDPRRPSAAARLPCFVSIPGAVQAKNGALALLAVRAAFPQENEAPLIRALEDFRLPARFERIRREPPVIIDGAHTPRSIALTAAAFRELYGDGILLFGCAADKDAAALAALLLPHFSRIIITAPGTFRSSDPLGVYRLFLAELRRQTDPGLPGEDRLRCVPETGQAIRRALDWGQDLGLPVLGTGSFYLAAEIRERSVHEDPVRIL